MTVTVSRNEPFIDVTRGPYNARGDGSHDDTDAIQAAIDAAVAVGGTVVIPPPDAGAWYVVTDTITIDPPSGTQTTLGIAGSGGLAQIRYTGANNQPVFKLLGGKFPTITNVTVYVPTASGVVVWDYQTDGTYESTGGATTTNCHVRFGSGTDNTGWRGVALPTAAVGDVSLMTWINCTVGGAEDAPEALLRRNTGWSNRSANGLIWNLIGCGTSFVHTLYTELGGAAYTAASAALDAPTITVDTTYGFPSAGTMTVYGIGDIPYTGKTATSFTGCGAHAAIPFAGYGLVDATPASGERGGGGAYFHGCAGSYSEVDFRFSLGDPRVITGGRWELGNRFIQTSDFGSYGYNSISLTGVNLSDYTPSDGKVVVLQSGDHLSINGGSFRMNAGSYTSDFIAISPTTGRYGSVTFSNEPFIQGTGPFLTVPTDGRWQVSGDIAVGSDINTITGSIRAEGGGWNSGHLLLGVYHLWIDTTGDLRIKSSAPSSDLDGTVVGTQS